VIVASSRSQIIDLLRTFRVANVVFTWSLGSGVQVAFDFQNYFVARHGITEQLGKNVLAPVSKTLITDKSKRPKVITPAKPVLKSLTGKEKTSLSKLDEKGFFENSAGGQEFF